MDDTPQATEAALQAFPPTPTPTPAVWAARAAVYASRHEHEQAWLAAQQAGRARQQRQAREAQARAAAMAAHLQTERAHTERDRLAQLAAHAQQQAELLDQTQALLEQLARIGMEITEQLDIDAVLSRIHGHLHALVDAPHLSIWLLDDAGESLHLRFGVDDGRAMAAASISLSDARSALVRCWQEQAEVEHAGNAAEVDLSPMPAPTHAPVQARWCTGVYCPLTVRDKALGVIAVESARADAYGERERLVLRSVCAYGAIALDNAAVYAGLDGARRALQRSSEAERRAREQAEQATRTKSEFLADIADALHAPLERLHQSLSQLKALPLAAEDVADQMPQTVPGHVAQARAEILYQALGQSEDVNRLARRLLELARLEAGAVERVAEAFSMVDLVQDVLLKMQAAAPDAQRLQPVIEGPLVDVVADIAMVERALSTFVDFAIRRTPAAGHVRLCLHAAGDGVRVLIADSGPALTAQALRERFDRPTNTTDPAHPSGGQGLDLAIARQMLRLNGSEVHLRSRGAAGVEIAFTLAAAAG